MSNTLQVAARNVSQKIEETHNQLDNTISTMKQVVTEATIKIYAVKENVTKELAFMGQKVTDLNNVVNIAQDTIHFEVKDIKDNIDQYVAVTNKQFAAENDFVKYQLAGMNV